MNVLNVFSAPSKRQTTEIWIETLHFTFLACLHAWPCGNVNVFIEKVKFFRLRHWLEPLRYDIVAITIFISLYAVILNMFLTKLILLFDTWNFFYEYSFYSFVCNWRIISKSKKELALASVCEWVCDLYYRIARNMWRFCSS